MGFVLKMAWRDSRMARRRPVPFPLSIVLGVAALAGAVGAVTAITLVAGWLSGRGLTNRPPLEVLREEA